MFRDLFFCDLSHTSNRAPLVFVDHWAIDFENGTVDVWYALGDPVTTLDISSNVTRNGSYALKATRPAYVKKLH